LHVNLLYFNAPSVAALEFSTPISKGLLAGHCTFYGREVLFSCDGHSFGQWWP